MPTLPAAVSTLRAKAARIGARSRSSELTPRTVRAARARGELTAAEHDVLQRAIRDEQSTLTGASAADVDRVLERYVDAFAQADEKATAASRGASATRRSDAWTRGCATSSCSGCRRSPPPTSSRRGTRRSPRRPVYHVADLLQRLDKLLD